MREKQMPGGIRLFVLSLLVVTVVLSFLIAPGEVVAENIPLNAQGIYRATASDGSMIYLYRYAPYTTGTPKFNTSGTPVLVFTGICMNMNQYLSCTPAGKERLYSDVYVPPVSSAPEWALNPDRTDYEPYIKADRMRYYSLAHFLWLQGFDPWFANYRGAGRDPVASTATNPKGMTTLDTWATQDVPAAIAKVKSVTGKRMFIGGHSTGGLVSYEYLQGAYMDYGRWSWLKELYYRSCYAFGYMPHVKSSASLAASRNNDVKGFIGLDPAGVPPLPANILDRPLFWGLVGTRLYLPLDAMSDQLIQRLPGKKLLVGVMDTFLGIINDYAGGDGALGELLGYLNFWNVEDMDPCMEDWMLRYSIGGASLRGFGQYMDMGLRYTLREHYLNGSENYLSKRFSGGPTPAPGRDGYYYYDENIARMSVPLIVFSSSAGALVAPEETYEFIISRKTPTAYDRWYVVNGTAHVDVAMGNRLPTAVFPLLGEWLKTVDALPSAPPATDVPAPRIDI